MPTKLTTEEFINKAKQVHGDRYSYYSSKYVNINTEIIIICPTHGPFKQKPHNHLYGKYKKGCQKCGRDNRFLNHSEFIKKSEQVHDNKYTYEDVKYSTTKTKVNITCPTHGTFSQKPNDHISGYGCVKCGHDKAKRNRGYYSKAFFEGNPNTKDGNGNLYLVKLFNEFESFYKIGITKTTTDCRLKRITQYKTELVYEITNISLYQAYCLEQHILDLYGKFKYNPHITFNGHTECFILEGVDIKNIIAEIHNT